LTSCRHDVLAGPKTAIDREKFDFPVDFRSVFVVAVSSTKSWSRSWACHASIRRLSLITAPAFIDDADPEHDAVIDTVRGRQCAVLNFPAQNSSFEIVNGGGKPGHMAAE